MNRYSQSVLYDVFYDRILKESVQLASTFREHLLKRVIHERKKMANCFSRRSLSMPLITLCNKVKLTYQSLKKRKPHQPQENIFLNRLLFKFKLCCRVLKVLIRLAGPFNINGCLHLPRQNVI